MKTDFFVRAHLPAGVCIHGPAVLFQKDSTTVIPPDWIARVDDFMNLIISRDSAEDKMPELAGNAEAEERICQ